MVKKNLPHGLRSRIPIDLNLVQVGGESRQESLFLPVDSSAERPCWDCRGRFLSVSLYHRSTVESEREINKLK